MRYIEQFLQASGSPSDTLRLYDQLTLPDVSGSSLRDATVSLKDHLMHTLGFQYADAGFLAHHVLEKRGGNCLGLPLLIGSLLHDQGYHPPLKIIVTPRDVTYQLEQTFFARLKDDLSYDHPQLAMERDLFPAYRFAPLEHLVIGNSEFGVEITSEEDSVPTAESTRELSFTQALSGVYKDRAVTELIKGNPQGALKLAEEGLKLWKDNGEIYLIIAACAESLFDDERYEKAIANYQRLKREDTLWDMGMFSLTNDQSYLDSGVTRYPTVVGGLTAKALKSFKEEHDFREAKYLFALASHCYSYVAYATELSELFSTEMVSEILTSNSEHWGDINYHLSVFRISGNMDHLNEAKEAVETPADSLKFLAASRGTSLYSSAELRALEKKHASSRLFQRMKKDLNI